MFAEPGEWTTSTIVLWRRPPLLQQAYVKGQEGDSTRNVALGRRTIYCVGMSTPALCIFGGVLEREALNTADDFAEGVVFFALIGNESYGGCVRVKQAVGSLAGEVPLEVGPPLAYKGPAFDHGLLADMVRWYWTTSRAELLESTIGHPERIPGSILKVNMTTTFTRQIKLPFDRDSFSRMRDAKQSD